MPKHRLVKDFCEKWPGVDKQPLKKVLALHACEAIRKPAGDAFVAARAYRPGDSGSEAQPQSEFCSLRFGNWWDLPPMRE